MKCNKCGYDWSNSGDSAHVCGPVKVKQQEQGEPKQEDYLSKAYRLANELRCHLAISPAPQQRTWVGLTDYEIGVCSTEAAINRNDMVGGAIIFAKFIEAKLREKNSL